MKKIAIALLALLVLTGCAKTETKSFEMTEQEDGYIYTYKHTYTAKNDHITEGTIVTTIEIENPLDGEIEAMIEFLKQEEACPYGTLDDQGNQTENCSKYITVTLAQDGNKLTTTEKIDFAGAEKNKEDIYDEAAGGEYEDGVYYSMELFVSDLAEMGFTEVK